MKQLFFCLFTVTVLALTSVAGGAQTDEYANPELLVSAADLQKAIPNPKDAQLRERPLLIIDVREPEDARISQ